MRIDQIKIKPRLIGAFLVVAFIAAAIGYIGLKNIREIGEVRLPGVYGLGEMKSAQQAIWVAERGLINDRMMEASVRQAQYDWIKDRWVEANEGHALFDSLPKTPEGARMWEELKPQWENWRELHQRVVDLSLEKDALLASGLSAGAPQVLKLDDEVFQASLDARQAALPTSALIDDLADRNMNLANEALGAAVRGMTIAILIGFVAALGLGVFIAMSVVKPVKATTDMLKDIAQGEGDLTRRLDASGKDEISELCTWFNTFVQKIHDSIVMVGQTSQKVSASAEELSATAQDTGTAAQQIAQTIEQVAKGSTDQSAQATNTSSAMQQLIAAIDELSNGTQQQASVVQSATASIQEITDSIAQVAQGAEAAAVSSNEVANVARSGQQSVDKTVQGMQRIRETAQAAAESIQQLGEASNQIGTIVEAIDDIAEQTNLLALNAAIEAARAGEHGKGFAVVADEVRKLAERSGKETKEIASLITQIQTLTQNAVAAMEAGTTEVQTGSELAGEAGNALAQITAAVDEVVRQAEAVSAAAETMNSSSTEVMRSIESVSSITQETASSAEVMSESSREVMSNVDQVASISQENAAAAEEVSAATQEQNASVEELSASSEELARAALELQELVNQFKVDETSSVTGKPDLKTVPGGSTAHRKAA